MEIYAGNVSDEVSVKGMVSHCVEVFGRIDIACNNAGVSGTSSRTSEASMKDFDFVCSVNERGVSDSNPKKDSETSVPRVINYKYQLIN